MANTTFNPDNIEKNPCGFEEIVDNFQRMGEILEDIETDITNVVEGDTTPGEAGSQTDDGEIFDATGTSGDDQPGILIGIVATDVGTVQIASSSPDPKVEGAYYDFDGSADYYKIEQPFIMPLLGDGDGIYITAWVQVDATGTNWPIFTYGDGTNDYFVGGFNGTNFDTFSYDAGASGVTATHGTSISTATWYFVEWWLKWFTGEVGVNVNRGTAVTATTTNGWDYGNAGPMWIGTDNGSTTFFNGKLEQIMIQSGCPSSAMLDERYNSGSGSTTWYA